jgi:8-oxo-dGTP diphosphatase
MADNVRAIICNPKQKFLILTESDDPDNWKLPGGKIDSGEDPQSAIKRELQEELGLHIPSESELKFKKLTTDDGLSTRYIFKVEASPEQITPNPDEITKLKWVTLSSIPNCQNQNHIQTAVESVLQQSQAL